jgi:hypothetical protein
MTSRVLSAVERVRAAGFKALAGTHVEAVVPVTQHLVDVLVAQAAAERHLPGLKVTLRADREIGVAMVKSVFGFDTRLSIDLRVRGPVDMASDPRLYLVIARPSFTWSALSRVIVAAGLAPPGVEVGKDGVAVDLRTIASRAGVADLMAVVQTLAFDGEDGRLRVHVVADVPDGGIAVDPTRAPSSAGGAARHATVPHRTALLQELRGARVWGRIAISEELANQLLGLALEEARTPTPRADSPAAPAAASGAPNAAAVAQWIQRAGVRFENGRMVLEPDVVIG